MILVRFNDCIVNMQHIQAINLAGTKIEFELPGELCYSKKYASEQEAELAYEKLFTDFASCKGVDGAVLS